MSRLACIAGLAASLVTLIAPGVALACSVCIGIQNEDTTAAYRAMTAFMTFTPMAIIGGVIFWIHRRFKALDAEDAARSELLVRTVPQDLGR